MSMQPRDPYDLSYLVKDEALKREFQSKAWMALVQLRMEVGGETQVQAAQFVLRKYHGGAEAQLGAEDLSPPQPI